MEMQIAAFKKAKFPVYIIQGAEDKGQVYEKLMRISVFFRLYLNFKKILQPVRLFDGTASMEIVEAPVKGIKEYFTRVNRTHQCKTHYSANGEVIGPTADKFFPNR